MDPAITLGGYRQRQREERWERLQERDELHGQEEVDTDATQDNVQESEMNSDSDAPRW